MVDVKETKLVMFFAKNEKEGVWKLQKFGKVIPPNGTSDLHEYEIREINQDKNKITRQLFNTKIH